MTNDWDILLGPLSGLAISLFFCFSFLKRFENTTERLVLAFEKEVEECNKRYAFLLSELIKLRERQQ